MVNKEASVDNYDIDAIEKKMEQMSTEVASKLGEPTEAPKGKE